jgi:hypothetical protein
MKWIPHVALLLSSSAGLILLFEIFAFALRRAARLSRTLKFLLSLLAYFLLTLCLTLPVFLFERFDDAERYANEDYGFVTALVYALSLWLAIAFFYQRHMANLKSLGYYQSRRH